MSRWVKFVALFIVLFAVVDVCSAEHCGVKIPPIGQASVQVQVQSEANAEHGCQFEEDCFACAHYAPASAFLASCAAEMSFDDTGLYAPTLDGAPAAQYHPPRG